MKGIKVELKDQGQGASLVAFISVVFISVANTGKHYLKYQNLLFHMVRLRSFVFTWPNGGKERLFRRQGHL